MTSTSTTGAGSALLRFDTLDQRTADRRVHDQLRRAILHGQLRPGQWLRQEELAASFGVSRMPVRDALRLLEADGLVEVLPHRGVRVAPLTAEELEELYAARIGLEGLAARYGAARVSPPVLAAMARALERLESRLHSEDLEAFLSAQAEFRQLCYAASGRERLCRTVAELRERATRYLREICDTPARLRDVMALQYALYDAAERRDGQDAERSTQEGLRWTLRQAQLLLAERDALAAPTLAGGPAAAPVSGDLRGGAH